MGLFYSLDMLNFGNFCVFENMKETLVIFIKTKETHVNFHVEFNKINSGKRDLLKSSK